MRRLTHTPSNDNDDLVARVTRELLDAVRSKVADASFATRERTALEISNEAVRRALQEFLQELADRDEEEIKIGVERYHRHQPGEIQYHSLCGALRVHRWTYRQSGVRNGPTVVPLELRAGLIERATPALAYAVAHGYAKAPIRSVERDLYAAHREPPSRATLERMARAIGTDAKESLMTLERGVRRTEEIPRQTRGITLGMDRTTVPMEEPREDGSDRIVVNYRMAYVGTVALTDRDGTVLKSWKYAGPAHEGPMQIVQRMMNDLRKTRSAKPRVRIGLVQDGAPELWGLMQDALRAERTIGRWHEAIDMYHLMERLSKALELVEPDEAQRAKQLEQWRKLLLRDDGGIARVARFFELKFGWLRSERKRQRQTWMSAGWMPAEHGLLAPMPRGMRRPPAPPPRRWNTAQADGVSRLLWCYLANPRFFRYATLARLGLHVGSGVTEGACKSLIAARAKRGGQRWREPGISAVLTLRSLVESERFDAFWKRFARRFAPLAHAA
jgi:hypothetical protein